MQERQQWTPMFTVDRCLDLAVFFLFVFATSIVMAIRAHRFRLFRARRQMQRLEARLTVEPTNDTLRDSIGRAKAALLRDEAAYKTATSPQKASTRMAINFVVSFGLPTIMQAFFKKLYMEHYRLKSQLYFTRLPEYMAPDSSWLSSVLSFQCPTKGPGVVSYFIAYRLCSRLAGALAKSLFPPYDVQNGRPLQRMLDMLNNVPGVAGFFPPGLLVHQDQR